jgi:peptide deformylase
MPGKEFSILKRGDPLLTKVSQPVVDLKNAVSIIEALSDALTRLQRLYKFSRGSGLSAPQIGYLSRISVVEYEGIRRVLINPEIIDHSVEKPLIKEGCLSFFDYRGQVPRYRHVLVKALNEQAEVVQISAQDNFAMLLQHEIDHLNGILYVDRMADEGKDLTIVPDMPNIP